MVTQVGHNARSHQFKPSSVQKIFYRIFCSLSPQLSFWLPTLPPTGPTPLGVKSTHVRIFIPKRRGYKCYILHSTPPKRKNFDKDPDGRFDNNSKNKKKKYFLINIFQSLCLPAYRKTVVISSKHSCRLTLS